MERSFRRQNAEHEYVQTRIIFLVILDICISCLQMIPLDRNMF
jgi:hypothetical protein